MQTIYLIKNKSILLFNDLGVVNVTLREVAKQLNKSYGNVTYHFPTKEDLIFALFEDMNDELSSLQTTSDTSFNLMEYFLKLPEYSFDISSKYLFFTKDFVEIKRHYPSLFLKAHHLNEERKIKWMFLLTQLKNDGFLNNQLEKEDLEYIMLLSTSIRTFYFQSVDFKEYNKINFSRQLNRLLKPYLSEKGLEVYHKFETNQKMDK